MNLLGYETNKDISPLNDPFKSDKIEGVYIWVKKWRGAFEFSGHIEFKNCDTEGKQKFTADDFQSLVQKMESFIKTL